VGHLSDIAKEMTVKLGEINEQMIAVILVFQDLCGLIYFATKMTGTIDVILFSMVPWVISVT